MDPLGDIAIPEEFVQFAGLFFEDDSEAPVPTLWELIDRTVAFSTTGRDIDALIRFLDILLDGNATDAALDRIWRRTIPTWGIRLGYHRKIFTRIRDAAREIRQERAAQ